MAERNIKQQRALKLANLAYFIIGIYLILVAIVILMVMYLFPESPEKPWEDFLFQSLIIISLALPVCTLTLGIVSLILFKTKRAAALIIISILAVLYIIWPFCNIQPF